MRATDLSPSWFVSSNWGNRNYEPWTEYLVGRIGEAEFARVCANPSDYCLRDVWDLRRATPSRIDWAASVPFNWNGIHALALRFYRSGDDIYLHKWLAVVGDFAGWTLAQSARPETPLTRGEPPALLDAALAWGGICTAWAIIAKGLRPTAPTASPFAAATGALQSGESDRLPAAAVADIATAFARGHALHLLRAYARPIYVPNQRAFGLEALACLAAWFPGSDGVAAWRPALHEALLDLCTRYNLPDGGQLEQSFNYAQSLVESMQRTARLPFSAPPPWRDAAEAAALGWWRMAAALATPDDGLPQVGNAAWGRFGRGAPPQRFAAASFAFPYSGLYVMRTALTRETPYLFFFHRRAARGHSMAGSNSIQVAAFGRQLLAAGGAALYGGPAGARRELVAYLAETSSYKTCTVLVDGRSQAAGSVFGLARAADGTPDITRAPLQPCPVRWSSSTDFDVVEGEYGEGYRGSLDDATASLVSDVRHLRRVVFVRALGLWLVVDVLRSAGMHDYTQVWKFSPPANGLAVRGFEEAQVTVLPNEQRIETADTTPGAANLRLQHFGIAGLQYRRHFGSGPLGWFAAGPLVMPVPAVDVHAQWRGRGDQVLLTLMRPLRGAVQQLAEATDLTGSGLAGCALAAPGGSRLTVLASAEPRTLRLGARSEQAEMLLLFQQDGKPDRGLVLSAERAHRFDGERVEAITVPQRLRWIEGADGRLAPAYNGNA